MQSAHLMKDPISNHSDAISHTHLLDRTPIHLMKDPISNHSDAISHTHLLNRAPIAYQVVQGAFEVLEDHLRRPLRIPNQSQCGRMGERRGQPCLVLELRSQLVGAPLGLLELLHSDLLAPEQPAKHL